MSLGQIAGPRAIQRIQHYMTFVKTNPILTSRHLYLGTTKFSSHVATDKTNFNNITKNAGTQLLAKRLVNPATNAQQIRSSSAASHWVKDKIFTSALPVIIPLAFVMENPVFDGLMAVLSVVHAHWGFEAILTDYARPVVIGKFLPEVLHLLLILFSTFTLCGLILIIYNGPGIAKGIKQLWALGPKKEEAGEAEEVE